MRGAGPAIVVSSSALLLGVDKGVDGVVGSVVVGIHVVHAEGTGNADANGRAREDAAAAALQAEGAVESSSSSSSHNTVTTASAARRMEWRMESAAANHRRAIVEGAVLSGAACGVSGLHFHILICR